jgi:ClpP class serine protease
MEKKRKKIEAVAFVVNSTGGSAVSSNIIANHLTTFCGMNKLKLYTFAESYALSGGYWILCPGDEVYAYNSSKVGSIGAVMTSLDFKEFIEKRHIERIYLSSSNENQGYII